MKRSLSFALLLLAFVSAFAQPKRGFEPNDLYTLKEVADAQIAPDGSRVAFTITEITPDHARTVTHIWLVPTKGGQPVRLTQDEANESAPRWSPDGKHLAFYSDRDRQDGLWVVATGGEPQLAAHVRRTNFFLTHAGESFTWSPDSRRIAFLSDPQSVLKATKVAAAAPSVAGGISDRLFRALTREEIERLPPATRDMILRAFTSR